VELISFHINELRNLFVVAGVDMTNLRAFCVRKVWVDVSVCGQQLLSAIGV